MSPGAKCGALTPKLVTPSHSCGYVGKPTTPGRARHALNLHSCDRHRAAAASQARRLAAHAAIDRTPKPCQHQHVNHQHGTYACYVFDVCRCVPCAAAHAAYARHVHRQRGYGRWQPFVDADPARLHVRQLMTAGIGLRRVAELTGVAHGSLTRLLYGAGGRPPPGRIRPGIAQRLLQLQPSGEALADGATVDATGTKRRIQALVAAGWSQARLATYLGVSPTAFGETLQRDQVTKAKAREVCALYDRLWNRPPPSATPTDRGAITRALAHARRNAWVPPMAWDDDTIDDPSARPDLGAHVRPTKLPPVDDLLFLLEAGESKTTLARRFRVRESAIEQALNRDRKAAAA